MVDVPGVELLSQSFKWRAKQAVSTSSHKFEDSLDPTVLPYNGREDYPRQHPEISHLALQATAPGWSSSL